MNYFVTAIGTDSGKTIISIILVEALQADYYKPIQSGTSDIDYKTVERLVNNSYSVIHPSQFIFETPVSPHHSAKLEGKEIMISDILFPHTDNTLIIEGAGGLLVPINEHGEFIADIIQKTICETVLVVDIYLGCINHTLLSVQELKRRNIKVKGIIFNGDSIPETEALILRESGYPCLLRVRREPQITQEIIKKYAIQLIENWHEA